MTQYPIVGSTDGGTAIFELTFPPGQMVFQARGSCRAVAYDLSPTMLTRLREMGPKLLTLSGTRVMVHADAVVRAFDDAFGARSMIAAEADEIERSGVKTVDPDKKEGVVLRVAHGQTMEVRPGELQNLNPLEDLKGAVASIPRFQIDDSGRRIHVRASPTGEWMRSSQVHEHLGL